MFALPKRVAAFVSFKMRQENYSYIRNNQKHLSKGSIGISEGLPVMARTTPNGCVVGLFRDS